MRTTTAYSNPAAYSFKAQRLPDVAAAVVAVVLEALRRLEPLVEQPVRPLVCQLVEHLLVPVPPHPERVAPRLELVHPEVELLVAERPAEEALAEVEAVPRPFPPSNLKPWPSNSTLRPV
jgi:hypothetical protein